MTRIVQQASLSSSSSALGATHVRSTLLQQSLRGVRNRGHFERWEAHVDPAYRELILDSIAPGWLAIDVGLAHYQACDQLGLEDAALEQIGEGVGENLQSTLLAVAARVALASVLSQEVISTCFSKLWPRLFQGGQFDMSHQNKTVTIELRGAVLSQSRYFRGTLLGNVRAGAKLFGQKVASVRALSYDARSDHYVVQLVGL